MKPRKVTVRFIDRAAAIAVGYTGDDLTIPVLLAANEINYTPGATGTYLGRAIQVISFTPESFR